MKIEQTPVAVENPQLAQVSKHFEALFMQEMVAAMQKTVSRGGLIPQGPAEKVFQGMLDQQHADRIAESGQIGLSKVIYEHLLRSQIKR